MLAGYDVHEKITRTREKQTIKADIQQTVK